MPNSYLNRTQEAATNRKKCTLSMWFKTTDSFGTRDYQLWETFYSASDRITVYIDSSDRLNWIDPSVSPGVHVGTNRKFRDPNAWYHVVFQIDTTESTASDRIKIYVNGVQETSLHSSTYYDQNDNAAFGTTNHINYIGKYGGNTNNNYDGYMSHVAFVDGSVVAPTVFGGTDSTSGIWKFKSPSGVTWGNCGTHLKFENSGALGTDSSGNSNTFTVNGNLRQALDTPSNVHATFNSLSTSSYITLSNGSNGFVGTTSSYVGNTYSTLVPNSGKWYAEFKITGVNSTGYPRLGIKQEYPDGFKLAHDSAGMPGYANNYEASIRPDGQRYRNNTNSAWSSTTFSSGDIIMIALDCDNGAGYFGKNGTWYESGDPTSGSSKTGSFVSWTSSQVSGGGQAFSLAAYDTASSGQANFGNGYFGTTAITSAGSNGNGSLFEYDVPSGYYALNTKNINTYG